MGFSVEPMMKYPFAHVFYKTPLHKYRIISIPMNLTPFNRKEKWGRYALDRQSKYEDSMEVNKTKEIMQREDSVPGYFFLKEKINRRYYMLRNSQEFVNTITQNSKNRIFQ